LWIGGVQSVARWLELLAFGVYVYDLTKSPLLVTAVTLVKLAPLALFGPIAGTLPARFAARKLYLAGISMMLTVTLAAWLYSLQHSLAVWQILLVSFIGGVFWVLDFPVRRKMLGDAVVPAILSRAVGLDSLANNGTRLLGPVLGGSLLQFTGLPGVLLLNLLLYSICLVATLQLSLGLQAERDVSGETSRDTLVGNLREGISVIGAQPVLIATLLVTVIFNLFGFPMLSLVPVLGREELNLSASVIGVLASMEGAGALIGGLLFLLYGQVGLFRKIYVLGVAGCLLFWLVAAASDNTFVMAGALLLVGISSACFAVMQTTLLILNCEYRYRSRVFGILSLSIGVGLIGFSQIGLFASWLGPRAALVLSSIMGLISLLAVCLRWPQIVARQPV
jgi:MFS family permease